LHGGAGVMADDAVSGLYGQAVMRLFVWLLPAWM
jgi:phosphatidylglycerophosphatase A